MPGKTPTCPHCGESLADSVAQWIENDEESVRLAVSSQINLSMNLARGTSAVSVELTLVSPEDAAREQALTALGKPTS